MKPFGGLALSCMLGIWIARTFPVPFFYAYGLCVASLAVTMMQMHKKYFFLMLMATYLMLGYVLYANATAAPVHHPRQFATTAHVHIHGQMANGLTQATARHRMQRPVSSVRRLVSNRFWQYFDAPHAAMLDALLLGRRRGVFFALKDAFVKTGTVHVLAISGLHVGLIAFILYAVSSALRIHRTVATVAILIILVFYVLITGARTPVVRAAIMVAIMLVGNLLQRVPVSYNSLGLAALIILFVNPRQLFSPSFQLSFTAVFSILFITPAISRRGAMRVAAHYGSMMRRIIQYVARLLGVSIAAWVGVAPLVAYYFNIASPIAVVGNLIVIPLTFLIIAATLSFIISTFFAEYLASIFSAATAGLLTALQFVVEKLSAIPFSYIQVPRPSALSIAAYYSALILLCGHERLGLSKPQRALGLLVIANSVIWLHLLN